MAFHTPTEFGKLIGKNSAFIRKDISRGNLVKSGKLLDDNFLVNKDYLSKMRAKLGFDDAVATVEPVMPSPKLPPISPPAVFNQGKSSYKGSDNVYDMEKEKSRLTLEKLREEIRLKRGQAEKLEGALIPTDVVVSIIRELSDAMKIAYSEAMETYTIVISAQMKLNNDQVAKIKTHFTAIINDTLKKQVVVAKKSLKNIIEEYSDVRGQGERKS